MADDAAGLAAQKDANGGVHGRLIAWHRAFREFLSIPLLVIAAFLLLAGVTYLLDVGRVGWLQPLREVMRTRIFGNAQATGQLLGTIAAGIITVTSITFSLLLLAVQQSGASLTALVFDQFLRRRSNQVYFGFFVGLALYALCTLATVNTPFNPVYGGTVALLLTGVALCLLVLLLYSTIDQMRPAQIIKAIHDHTLLGRERQRVLLSRTRRTPHLAGPICRPVHATGYGYVTSISLRQLEIATGQAAQAVEVVLDVSVGAFVAFQDAMAHVTAMTTTDAAAIATAVQRAIQLEPVRDLDGDPAYGVQQLTVIAWTSVSTAKQNPEVGLLVVHSLRDLLARWSVTDAQVEDAAAVLPVVYADDLPGRVLDAFAALSVAASESLQYQVYAEVLRALASLYDRLPIEQQQRAEDLILRSLSALGEHVLTRDLDDALATLCSALTKWGNQETTDAVRSAWHQLSKSVGRLNSRATRVPER